MGTDPEQSARERLVGSPVPRREDVKLLTGRGRFIDDLDDTGALHAAFVRSPFAHARVISIDVPDELEGVVAVFTAADLAGAARPLPPLPVESMEWLGERHPLLADGVVAYAGQPVAAVFAESRALAEDAAEEIFVDYEPLEAVVDALGAEERLVQWRRASGDVDAAFESADRVVTATHYLPRTTAAPMEPRGVIASHDAGADVLTMWVSAQDTVRPLNQLAHALDRPADSIRLVVPDVGGAFGSKGSMPPEGAVVAVAAMKLGRRVKWAEDRYENFLASGQGRGVHAEVSLALTDEGDMVGLRARIVADMGAYLQPTTAVPGHTTAMLMTGVYTIPVADVELVGARTNKVPLGPVRGAGRPEAAYFLERTVDVAARELGIDPVELRRRNLVREFPHASPLGFTYDSGDYERCLDTALRLAEPALAAAGESDAERVVGTGVALYVERAGGMYEAAHVTVEPDGRVVVRTGTSPHGQGHDTTFAQIVADKLGVDAESVALRFGDSAVVPRGIGTFASRSTAMGGSAIVLALDRILEQALPIAAQLLDAASPDEVVFGDGVYSVGDGRSVTFAEVAAASYQPLRLARGTEVGLEATARFSSPQVFGSGAYAAVVSIERATGALRVHTIAAVDDAGNIINPLLAEGQVLGGTVHGLGEVLTEESAFDEDGNQTTASFMDYSLLTAAELPPIEAEFVHSPSPFNPLGAKGIGEGGAIGTPAALANAVADALGGRDPGFPYTGERLWRAIHDKEVR